MYLGHLEDNAPHSEGAGIMLNPASARSLIEWNVVSSRITTARFFVKPCKIFIVQCYAPTNDADKEAKEEFYQQLQEIVNQKKKKDILVLMGYLNAKTGSENDGREMCVRKEGETNENGELFSDFCGFKGLVIGGSLFPHKKIHKTTMGLGADVGSDYLLVLGRFKLKLKNFKMTAEKTGYRYNTELLQDARTRDVFCVKLRNRFTALDNLIQEDTSVEQAWEQSKTVWKETCEETLDKRTRQHKEWISVKTLTNIKQKKT